MITTSKDSITREQRLDRQHGASSMDLLISQVESVTTIPKGGCGGAGVYGGVERWNNENADILADRVVSYMEHCAEYEKPLTLTGLCRTVGAKSRSTLYSMTGVDRSEKPATIVNLCLSAITEQHETGLHGKSVAGHIFALKNSRDAWHDTPPEKPQFTFIVANPMSTGGDIVVAPSGIESDEIAQLEAGGGIGELPPSRSGEVPQLDDAGMTEGSWL